MYTLKFRASEKQQVQETVTVISPVDDTVRMGI
jgi:hypothetical protein